MTYFQQEIERIKAEVYANEWQIANVIKTRRLIHENFDKPFTLDELSRQRFTSKYHLLRLFKRYYGQTPRQYLTDLRIEKAKELLRRGCSVIDTCFEVGYESPSTFSALFRSRVGLSPKGFQQKSNFQ